MGQFPAFFCISSPSCWPVGKALPMVIPWAYPRSVHPGPKPLWQELVLGSLTCFLTPKVLPTAGGSSACRLGMASLLIPKMPCALPPCKPRRLHQPPVPVLNPTREKNIPKTLDLTKTSPPQAIKQLKPIAFIYIIILLCGSKTLYLVNGGEVAER